MSGGSFAVEDYVVFVLMLLVSAAVGVYYAWVDRRKETSQNFLTGGRQMTAFPIALSLTASFMSSITVLSNPAEVYRFGAMFGLFGISYVATVVITCETFLPVFYRLGITSTYEYLELRFNRATRLFGTLIFIFQAMLQTGIVVYGPALALNQVTGLNLWVGIVSTGIVCTFYCTLGGLKAVAWTDVFQILIMLAGYLTVVVKTVVVQGGVSAIISDSHQGGRLNFWDFDINPLRRHTFWTITIGGTFGWMVIYGVNQAQVQRYFACKSLTHARVAVYVSGLGLCSFITCSVFAGLCIYSVYKDCDPWTAGQVSTPDQLLPHLVMEMLAIYPGVPGLFFTAVYCGSLSTVSTSINALAAVTVEDLIRPHTDWSEKHLSRISKALSLFFGILCICMAGLASVMGGMMQTGATITGVLGGPLLGIFTLGIFCPFANSKGGLSGLVIGLVGSLTVCIVAVISPPPPSMTRPLPLSMEGCSFNTTSSNWTTTAPPTEPSFFTTADHEEEAELLMPSYLYFTVIGCLTTIITGLIVSLLTGGLKTPTESKFMLNKDDTTVYHIVNFFQGRDMKSKKESDEKKDDKGGGVINPALCEIEL